MEEELKKEIVSFATNAKPGEKKTFAVDGVEYEIEAFEKDPEKKNDPARNCKYSSDLCDKCDLKTFVADDQGVCPCVDACLIGDYNGYAINFVVRRRTISVAELGVALGLSVDAANQAADEPNEDEAPIGPKGDRGPDGAPGVLSKKRGGFKATASRFPADAPESFRDVAKIAEHFYRRGFNDAKLDALVRLGQSRFQIVAGKSLDETERVRVDQDMTTFERTFKTCLLTLLSNMKPSTGFICVEGDGVSDDERAENEKLIAAFGGAVVEGTDADIEAVAGTETKSDDDFAQYIGERGASLDDPPGLETNDAETNPEVRFGG